MRSFEIDRSKQHEPTVGFTYDFLGAAAALNPSFLGNPLRAKDSNSCARLHLLGRRGLDGKGNEHEVPRHGRRFARITLPIA